jgi:acetyl-CoA acetyltransferase
MLLLCTPWHLQLTKPGRRMQHVEAVFAGNVVQSSLDAPYLSRHMGLKAGVPQKVPALTINRLCGSGFETVINGEEQFCAS